MDMPQSKKPYEKYYGKWVNIGNQSGNFSVCGRLVGIVDEALLLNPYEAIDWDVTEPRRKVLEQKDFLFPLYNVGYFKETSLSSILHFIASTNKEERENKKSQQNPG